MNNYITKIKSFTAMLVISTMVLSMASCSNSEANTGFLDQIPSTEITSEEEISIEESSEEQTIEGYTATPKVITVSNTAPRKVLVAGTCEQNAEITIYNIAKTEDVFTTKANNESFIIEIDIPEGEIGEQTFVITAKIDGKELSEEKMFTAQFDAVADPNKNSIILGNDSTLFYKSLLSNYRNETLYSISEINAFKENLKKMGSKFADTEVVYVMIPDMLTTYEHIVPEEYRPTETVYKRKYQQLIDALSKTEGFNCIDLTELFLSKKDGEYPIYYNTSSNLSDYGSYLVYSAIMQFIAESNKQTDITPTPSDDITEDPSDNVQSSPLLDLKYKFDLIDGKGGNLVTGLGLDNEVFTEKYYYASKDFASTIPEEAESNCKLSDLIVYSDATTNTLYTANAEDDIIGANEYIYFKTNRTELPSAIFLRDNTTNPIVSMLAENFNNSLFKEANTLSLDSAANDLASFATEGSEKVDYVFVIASIENVDNIYNSIFTVNNENANG